MELKITQSVEVFDTIGIYDKKRLTGEMEVTIKYDFNKDKEFTKDICLLIHKYFKEGNEKLCR